MLISLYSNRRNKFVHMGINFPLFFLEKFQDIILEIESFKKEELGKRFCFVFLNLIYTTHWTYDCIILKRKNL